MPLSRTLNLLYSTILHPVTAALFRGRDIRTPDLTRTLRPIAYTCPPDVPTDAFNAVYLRATSRQRNKLRARDLPLAFATLFPLVIAIHLYVRYFSLIRSGVPPILPMLFLLCSACGTASIIFTRVRRFIPYNIPVDRVRDAWLFTHRCPSCAYPGSWPNPHAPRHCPECGSLWPPAQP